MHVDRTSAREAKVESGAEFGRAATEAESAGEVVPAVAVGIGMLSPGDFTLAIRSEDRTGRVGRAIAAWMERLGGDVDARVIGPVRKLELPPFRRRLRPLVPGASVSLVDRGTGTIGSFVRGTGSEDVWILSNNHVLADENRAPAAAPVIQPGATDGGEAEPDRIGSVASFVPIDVAGVNLVDCAVATVDAGIDWSLATFAAHGGLTGVHEVGDEFPAVVKFGRTSGLTVGTVTAIEMDNLRVNYDVGVLRFDDQIEVASTIDGPFSAPGDSGSLVIAPDRQESRAAAVGLLFAGSQTGGPGGHGLTYMNPIASVLSALDVELVLDSAGG
jgi:hypothetical protein